MTHDAEEVTAAKATRSVRVLRAEQEHLWDDLNRALDRAMSGYWSIEVEGLARRIVLAGLVVGPTRWESVQWPLVAGGLYEALYKAGGVPVPAIDDGVWAIFSATMSGYFGPEVATALIARAERAAQEVNERGAEILA